MADRFSSKEHPSVADNHSIRVVLMGKTGSGKSSTGNTILGRAAFPVNHGFQSERMSCTQSGVYNGKPIQVVDTPGLFDSKADLELTAVEAVQNCLSLYPGPDAVLYVISIAQRFTDEDYSIYRYLKALFDEPVSKRIIIVFTGGGLLEKHGTTLEELLKTAPAALADMMYECGHRLVLLDNTNPDKRSQSDKLFLAFQDLADGREPFQNPYRHLPVTGQAEEVRRRLKQFQREELEEEEERVGRQNGTTNRQTVQRNGTHVITSSDSYKPYLFFVIGSFISLMIRCAWMIARDKMI